MMSVRTVMRRGERRILIDIRYRKPDGAKGRFRHDAEAQTLIAARAEERRRLAALAVTGSPYDTPVPVARPPETTKGPSFEEVGRQYLLLFAPSHLKPSTQVGYKVVIERVLGPKIGKLRVDKVDAATV